MVQLKAIFDFLKHSELKFNSEAVRERSPTLVNRPLFVKNFIWCCHLVIGTSLRELLFMFVDLKK